MNYKYFEWIDYNYAKFFNHPLKKSNNMAEIFYKLEVMAHDPKCWGTMISKLVEMRWDI